ncbi:DUF2510 domain-containing protein [Microbacterium ureisolvens]|uniref:DUF2510 domain-containing protein n=1 Tax=Microbacterium ureisolvens TaxID=2781186 RepID=A0ABS7HU69_9MICO|nr:DUF2510 domain-containing protein [Microbacterium ureisolvens]
MTDDAYPNAFAPPPGWLHDPSTAQTRWWDGSRWTDHVLPPRPGYGAVFELIPGWVERSPRRTGRRRPRSFWSSCNCSAVSP